jgi:hypothetical protein
MSDNRVAICGDLHFGFKNGNQVFLDFQKEWLSNHFLPELKKRGVTTFIQTGDFFDIRKYLPLNVLDMVLNWLPNQLAINGITQLIVPSGNHDLYYRDSNTISSLDILNTLSSDTLEVSVYSDHVGVHCINDKKFAFLPYLNKVPKEKLLSELASIKDVDYLIAHLDVVGAPMMAGHVCEDGVDLSIFNEYKRIISGHFHIPSTHKNLTYTGAPYHLSWGDISDGLPRGFYILDTDTNELELVPNPEYMTLFSIIEYDPNEKYKEDSFKLHEGNIVKVLVKEKNDEKHYKQFCKVLSSTSFIDYKILDTSSVEVERVEISESTLVMSTISAISSYIDLQGDDINKTSLKRLASEIYNEVINK